MSKQQKLLYGQAIFFLTIIVCFGLIIIQEKKDLILLPKINKEIKAYYNEKYSNNNLFLGKTNNKSNKYIAKVTSNTNKNHYFYIIYKNKKITDTYNKDYVEGNSILKHITEELTNSIKEKTNESFTISINNTLDKYTETVKEKILKEENLLELKIYTLSKEVTIDWDYNKITNYITNTINTCKNNKITPKYYEFTITDKEDITKSVEINNIEEDFIDNKNKENIIKDILENNNSNIIKSNKIEYKYLN